MLQREINRRRVALVNINGLVFQVRASLDAPGLGSYPILITCTIQVPMDSSDDQGDEEEEDEEEEEEEEEMLVEENQDNLEAVLCIDPIPDLAHSRT